MSKMAHFSSSYADGNDTVVFGVKVPAANKMFRTAIKNAKNLTSNPQSQVILHQLWLTIFVQVL